MSRSFFGVILAVAVCALPAPVANAQGTISEVQNGVTTRFVRNAGAFSASPSANLTGVSSPTSEDHVFESGWWYRVQGDTRESFFPAPTTQDYDGTMSTIGWTGFATGFFTTPLDALEIAIVTNAKLTPESPEGGFVFQEVEIWNPNPGPVTIDIFHMLDMDLQPLESNDQAELIGALQPNAIRIFDAGTNEAVYVSNDADGYIVRPFGANDVAALLSDTAVDDFTNTPLPLAPMDLAIGMQWTNRVIPAKGFAVFTVGFGVNSNFDPYSLVADIFQGGFEPRTLFAYDFGARQLISFKANAPQTVTIRPITGLGDENILGLAFRPRDGKLFSVGNLGATAGRRLFELDPGSGAATAIGTVDLPSAGNLAGIGMAFDPVQDRLRLIASDSLNRRVNPISGGLTNSNPNLTWAPGDVNAGGFAPQVYHIAYTNSKAFETSTRLIGLTESLVVVEIDPVSGITTTLGSLPPESDPVSIGGFDIDGQSGIAYVMYGNRLYSFNLQDFIVTEVGIIGGAVGAVNLLDGLTIQQ